MRKILCIFIGLIVLLMSGCGTQPKEKSVSASLEAAKDFEMSIDKTKPYEVMRDSKFRNGLDLSGFNSLSTSQIVVGSIEYNHSVSGKRFWRVDQWGCKNNLKDVEGKQEGDFWVQEDKSKKFAVNTKTGGYKMVLNTSKEYVDENGLHKPRVANQNWPCILLTQFTNLVSLAELDNLYMNVEFIINSVENKMGDTFDAGLHSAQFQWYITPQVFDKKTKTMGDMFWFGIPFYDYRYPEIPEFSAIDGGKDDATGKYIYMTAGKEMFPKGSATIGVREIVSIDVLPYIRSSFLKGQSQQFLQGVDFNDLVISSTNIGWEVPGTFDIDMEVFSMSLTAVFKAQ